MQNEEFKHHYASFRRLLSRWEARSTVFPNGTLGICPTPHVAPLAWLHKLYPPLNEPGLDKVERLFEFSLPLPYRYLLGQNNGMRLFSGSFSMSGMLGSLSRDPFSPQPISIEQGHFEFRHSHPAFFRKGYREVAGIVIEDLCRVAIDRDGHTILISPNKVDILAQFETLFDLLIKFIEAIDVFFTDAGERLSSYSAVQSSVLTTLGKNVVQKLN